MNSIQSREIQEALEDLCPCRTVQIRQLTAIYGDEHPSPRNLVVYGIGGTGKLHTVRSVLEARKIAYAVVRSEECLSLRHLLSTIQNACVQATNADRDGQVRGVDIGRAESVNALGVNLQRLLRGRDERLVLVLDGIDQQRGLHPTTLPALVRLRDMIPTLCLILVVTTPRPMSLQKAGIPYLHFPPYNRTDSLSLVTRSPPLLAPSDHFGHNDDLPTLQKWYSLFTATIYDSIHTMTSLSLPHLRETCEIIWPRFIWPYVSGEKAAGRGKNAQWDFQKLLVRQRSLLQNAAGETLVASLLPKVTEARTFEELQQEQENMEVDLPIKTQPPLATTRSATISIIPPSPFLPFFPTLLLTASYLASHTPPKLDILLFSHISTSSRSARTKRNYHKRKLLLQSPSKPKRNDNNNDNNSGPNTPKKSTKKTPTLKKTKTNQVSTTPPRPFPLDRLVAILRTIHPTGVPVNRSLTDRVMRWLVRLEGLRLVVCVDADGRGFGRAYGGGEERRWRVNVSRAFVEEVGAGFGAGREGEREGGGEWGGAAGAGAGAGEVSLKGLIRDYDLVD